MNNLISIFFHASGVGKWNLIYTLNEFWEKKVISERKQS